MTRTVMAGVAGIVLDKASLNGQCMASATKEGNAARSRSRSRSRSWAAPRHAGLSMDDVVAQMRDAIADCKEQLLANVETAGDSDWPRLIRMMSLAVDIPTDSTKLLALARALKGKKSLAMVAAFMSSDGLALLRSWLEATLGKEDVGLLSAPRPDNLAGHLIRLLLELPLTTTIMRTSGLKKALLAVERREPGLHLLVRKLRLQVEKFPASEALVHETIKELVELGGILGFHREGDDAGGGGIERAVVARRSSAPQSNGNGSQRPSALRSHAAKKRV